MFKNPLLVDEERQKARAWAQARGIDTNIDYTTSIPFNLASSTSMDAPLIYEDNFCAVIADTNPKAPLHLLVYPRDKTGLERLSYSQYDKYGLVGHLVYVAKSMAVQYGCAESGFRIVINDGPNGGQTSSFGGACACGKNDVMAAWVNTPVV